MKRGTNAVEPVPTSSVWMAVEEKAVAPRDDVDHGAGHLVLQVLRVVRAHGRGGLAVLGGVVQQGHLRPTPITNVITSWMPIVSGLVTSSFARSVVAR